MKTKNILVIFLVGLLQWAWSQNPACAFANNLVGASDDQGRNLVVDGSGNVFVVGRFAGTVDFDPSAGTANLVSSGGDDAFVAKYSNAGVYQWAIKIGSAGNETAEGVSVDASGDVYVSGGFFNTIDFNPGAGVNNLVSSGSDDIFVAKYSSAGVYQWAIKIGGTGSDVSRSCAYDATGNVYVTGRLGSANADFDPGAGSALLSTAGNDDIFLAKYSSAAGAYQWAFRVGAGNGDSGEGVSTDGSGTAFLTGFFQSTADFNPGAGTNNLISAGNDDIYVASYTSAGAYSWAFRIGGTNQDQGRNVVYSSIGTGALAVTGYFAGTNVDFDPSGSTANRSSNGNDDAFVGKYTPAGTFFWAFGFGSAGGAERGEGIAIDGVGNVYVAGRLNGTADFNPAAGVNNISNSGGGEDLYVAEYASDGSYQFAFNVGGPNTDRAAGVSVSSTGDMYITGLFAAALNVDFDPTAATVNLTTGNAGNDNVFVAKYSTSVFLPITLTEFTAEKNGETVNIMWSTASEYNNDFFTVERSADGEHFEPILTRKGAGTSITPNTYLALDEHPLSGISYYRFKQNDYDGSFDYSDIVVVDLRNVPKAEFNLYPNPASQNVQISAILSKNAITELSILNPWGQPLNSLNFLTGDTGAIDLPLNISDLQPGIYTITLRSGSCLLHQKLIVK
jgi:hypothetical protein